MSLIESLTSRIKSVQSKLEHYIDGRPTIQIMVEETLKIEGEKTKSSTVEMDGDYEIYSDGRLALKNPICPIHGNQYITKNGWTKNTLEIITGDKIKIVRQMHICTKCGIILMPSLECLKIPYGRITKDGQRFLLEIDLEKIKQSMNFYLRLSTYPKSRKIMMYTKGLMTTRKIGHDYEISDELWKKNRTITTTTEAKKEVWKTKKG